MLLNLKKSNFPQEFIIPFTFLFSPSLNEFNKLLRNKGLGKSYSSQDDKEEDRQSVSPPSFPAYLNCLSPISWSWYFPWKPSFWYYDDAMVLWCCYDTPLKGEEGRHWQIRGETKGTWRKRKGWMANKRRKMGKNYWEDGSVSDVLTLWAWGPGSETQNFYKHPGHSVKHL